MKCCDSAVSDCLKKQILLRRWKTLDHKRSRKCRKWENCDKEMNTFNLSESFRSAFLVKMILQMIRQQMNVEGCMEAMHMKESENLKTDEERC